MRRFATLYEALDTTTSINAKVDAMVDYFTTAPAEDAAWAVFLLMGQRFKRLVRSASLREWATAAADMPAWLFEECYASVGDLAETITLVLDERGDIAEGHDLPLHRWVIERIEPLRRLEPDEQQAEITSWWRALPRRERFVVNKLLTGALRVGVSRTLVERAVARVADLPRETVAHRLMGGWDASAGAWRALIAQDDGEADLARPYPFFLAYALDEPLDALGDVADWMIEDKWDGIRGQLIRRGGETFLWSRGEDLVTERYPEIEAMAAALPDGTVLDGEILAWRDGAPLPFSVLQKRIGRKRVGKKTLADAPVTFMAYDQLEHAGEDLRERPGHERRACLEATLQGLDGFELSTIVDVSSWSDVEAHRASARDRRVEGLMLKRRDAPYGVGRKRGAWFKHKLAPITIDAVLIYAQAGHGKRASLFTDYTFAVWRDDELTPIAKAYSGLDNAEIRELDRWIRSNTIERFGPVRSVPAEHVFEIAFEGLHRSTRHKSGLAVRFPRIARWRRDKGPGDADHLDRLVEMVERLERGEGPT